MQHQSHEDTVLVDVDDLVRGPVERDALSSVFVSVCLQSPYNEMPKEIQKRVVDEIVDIGKVVDGKYYLDMSTVGDEVALGI